MTRCLFFVSLLTVICFPCFRCAAREQIFREEEKYILEADSLTGVAEMKQTSILEESLSFYPRSKSNPYKFKAKEIILPVALAGLGGLGFTEWWKKDINIPIKDKLQEDGHKELWIDNVTLWLPAVAGYGMNLFGFKGRHDVVDATILYATAYILCGAATYGLKYSVCSPRPNLKNDRSFPSGHTAIAFCGAELLRREYWDISPWIGVGGYAVAAFTGFMRLYNDYHWLNDVLAGAGIGILSAEAAYWLFPLITKALFKKRYYNNIYLVPSVTPGNMALSCGFDF